MGPFPSCRSSTTRSFIEGVFLHQLFFQNRNPRLYCRTFPEGPLEFLDPCSQTAESEEPPETLLRWLRQTPTPTARLWVPLLVRTWCTTSSFQTAPTSPCPVTSMIAENQSGQAAGGRLLPSVPTSSNVRSADMESPPTTTEPRPRYNSEPLPGNTTNGSIPMTDVR